MAILRAGPWWNGTQGGAVDSPDYDFWGPQTGNVFPVGSPVNCASNDWQNQPWVGRADFGDSSDPGPGYGGQTFSLNEYVENYRPWDFAYLYFTFHYQATEAFDLKQTLQTFGYSGFGDHVVIFNTIEDGEVFNYFNSIGGIATSTHTFTLPATTLGSASFYMGEESLLFDNKIKSKLERV